MIVLGVDPGLANLGLGLVKGNSRRATHLHHVCINTRSDMAMPARLHILYQAVREALHKYQPVAVAIEEQRLKKQADVSFKVGQAYGVVLLACAQADVTVHTYGPMQVKKALVGTGRADKEQVIYMVKASLGIRELSNNHAADALALALTHLAHVPMQTLQDRAGHRFKNSRS